MNEKIALIDGDIIVYKVAYEKPKSPLADTREVGDVPFSSEGVASSAEEHVERSWEEVRQSVDEFMQHIRNETGTTSYVGFLSANRTMNFRTGLSKEIVYKGNREDREVPRFFQEIKQYLIREYNFIKLTYIETDDALACIQTYYLGLKETNLFKETVICSIDKDMLQVEGRHWNWKSNDYTEVSHEVAYRRLWTQVLTGDTTDNILGCGSKEQLVYKSGSKKGEPYVARVGVGPKEAENIISKFPISLLPIQVMVEFVNRFGLHKGINKFYEAFNLIFLLRAWPEFEEEIIPWEEALKTTDWFKVKEEEAEDENTF
jgi:hypothetical protein